jgi:hypothetical protein
MRDIRTKYKKSGWGWSPLRHWKRRMDRDMKKLLND